MSTTLDLSNPNRTIHAGVILMNSETELLDVAPIDLLHSLTKHWNKGFSSVLPDGVESQAIDIEFHWVSKNGPAIPNKLTTSINLVATDSFETCPPLDIVLIGAHAAGYAPDGTELDFVRKAYNDCSAFLSICGGMLVPLQAGILKGKTATGPCIFLEKFRQNAPETNWVRKRWVRDGKLWTSGALLNGLDMMFNFIRHHRGEGEDKLVDFWSKLGAWPDRDVDFKDVE
ncbi:hypothetical protein FGRMN_5095 [Fusarium graminum]|nr:hypothetical protein FGRMN_5095 [Fusarium graminum]